MKLTRKNLDILVVEDDDDDAELLRFALSEAGFIQSLTHFKNGAIALEYFKYTKATGSSVPHLILLDLNMPLEVAKLGIFRFLKKQANCANVITALGDFIDFYNNEATSTTARRNVPFVIPNKTGFGFGRRSRTDLS
jgi:CheY-like chemotaxis protein